MQASLRRTQAYKKIPLIAGSIAAAEKEGLPGGDPGRGDPAAAMASFAVASSAFFIVLSPSVSRASIGLRTIKNPAYRGIPLRLRRKRDSNPRSRGSGTTVFKTAAFDHSAISPVLQK